MVSLLKNFDLLAYIVPGLQKYPKLSLIDNINAFGVIGEFDIQNQNNEVLDTYLIFMTFPNLYPYCYPKVFEIGGKIKRNPENHINDDGSICITARPLELINCAKKMPFENFLQDKLTKRLAMESVKVLDNGKYPNGEFPHGVDGNMKSYSQILGISDQKKVREILESYSQFGNKKSNKGIHQSIHEKLNLIGIGQIIYDLNKLKKKDFND